MIFLVLSGALSAPVSWPGRFVTVSLASVALALGLPLSVASGGTSSAADAAAARSDWTRSLDAARVEQIASWLPPAPVGFGPTVLDRAAFNSVASGAGAKAALAAAEAMLREPFPAWSDEIYLECSRTGERKRGDEMIRARQRRLSTLVWAECLEDRGRFLPAIDAALRETVAQPTWTSPAHDSSLNSFRRRRNTVDLTAAATAHDLAQTLHLLGDRVPAATRASVMATLRERVFEPVIASMGGEKINWWLTATSNWNSVCLAGVTGAALATLPTAEERALFVAIAEKFSRNAVRGYGADGYCSEGVGYWNYGFGHYCVLRELVHSATGGRIELFSDPKLRETALYPRRMEMGDGVFAAISDCRADARPDRGVLRYCDRVFGLGLGLAGDPDTLSANSVGPECVFLFGRRAPAPTRAAGEGGPDSLRSYFGEGGVLVCRSDRERRFAATLKGGNNQELHNHNDVGSFSLSVGREPLVGDPGGPLFYRADTFGSQRYTKYRRFRSLNHPVPLVADVEQSAGRAAAAKVLAADFTAGRDVFSLDLSPCYEVPDLRRLVRTFTFARGAEPSLEVRDEFEYATPRPFAITLIALRSWRRTGPDTFEFFANGERLGARVRASGSFDIDVHEVQEDGPAFVRIGIRLLSPSAKGEILTVFTPLSTGLDNVRK